MARRWRMQGGRGMAAAPEEGGGGAVGMDKMEEGSAIYGGGKLRSREKGDRG